MTAPLELVPVIVRDRHMGVHTPAASVRDPSNSRGVQICSKALQKVFRLMIRPRMPGRQMLTRL